MALATEPEKKVKYEAEVIRYKSEKEDIKKVSERFEKQSMAADEASKHALSPHNKLAQAMTLIQIAFTRLAMCAYTRRWMLGLAGVAAAGRLVYWALAFTMTGV